MFIRNLWLTARRRFLDLQQASADYWRDCSNTYLASEEYYAKRYAAVSETLASLPRLRTAVDVGCGDGRFTRLIAARAESTLGFDISPALIGKARDAARADNAQHVRFEVAAIDDLPPLPPASLVACMGVYSCFVDEAAYLRALGRCAGLVDVDGYMLLVDTLAEGMAITRAYRSGYVARYRPMERYERAVLEAGFRLEVRREIARMSADTVNNLYLFRRHAGVT